MSFEQNINRWRNLNRSIPSNSPILPSPPDPRDYEEPLVSVSMLPDNVKLPLSPIVLNQGQHPFCGGASGAGIANSFYNDQLCMPTDGFSMTYIYWLCKKYDGIPDAPGTYLRTVCKIMNKYGCSPENLYPYSGTTVEKPIPQKAFNEAANYKLGTYNKLVTLIDMKAALNRGNYILIATFVTSNNWKAGNKGWISESSGDLMGGHATYIYGYDDSMVDPNNKHKGYFLCANSWGDRWGDRSKFYLPYDYLKMKLPNTDINKFMEAWSLSMELSPKPERELKFRRDMAKRKMRGKGVRSYE